MDRDHDPAGHFRPGDRHAPRRRTRPADRWLPVLRDPGDLRPRNRHLGQPEGHARVATKRAGFDAAPRRQSAHLRGCRRRLLPRAVPLEHRDLRPDRPCLGSHRRDEASTNLPHRVPSRVRGTVGSVRPRSGQLRGAPQPRYRPMDSGPSVAGAGTGGPESRHPRRRADPHRRRLAVRPGRGAGFDRGGLRSRRRLVDDRRRHARGPERPRRGAPGRWASPRRVRSFGDRCVVERGDLRPHVGDLDAHRPDGQQSLQRECIRPDRWPDRGRRRRPLWPAGGGDTRPQHGSVDRPRHHCPGYRLDHGDAARRQPNSRRREPRRPAVRPVHRKLVTDRTDQSSNWSVHGNTPLGRTRPGRRRRRAPGRHSLDEPGVRPEHRTLEQPRRAWQ